MEPSENKGGGVAQWPARVKSYFGDLQAEMRRVTWPSSKQVRATTGVVIATIFGFAIYFAIVDVVLGRGIDWIFRSAR